MAGEKVLILGALGGFGSLLSTFLSSEGYDLTGIDTRAPSPNERVPYVEFITMDVSAQGRALLDVVAGYEWIIACLPQSATLDVLACASSGMKSGAMFMDILSVKTPIAARIRESRQDLEYFSVHPMFAPSVGFGEQNVVIVEAKHGKHSDTMEALFQRWGARLYRLTAEQHDRATAAIQVATHAAIISFGVCLRNMRYEISEALPMSSPPHRLMLSLLARIVGGSPEVYWQIQAENPFAVQVCSELIEAASEVRQAVEEGDPASFAGLLKGIYKLLEPNREDLTNLAARAITLPLS